MHLWDIIFILTVIVLVSVACTPGPEPSATPTHKPTSPPEPTPTQMVQELDIAGPDCDFQTQSVSQNVEIGANGSLTLTLGSTPSIACGWQAPEIEDQSVVRQADHQSQWPAEGMTPMPGAPGTEIWVFETLKEGESNISWKCVCLAEEGSQEETSGTFVLQVRVKE